MSWEHLLGDSAYHADGLTRIANRLKQSFPNARIILYVREQLALLKAIYAQYVQEGGTWTLDEFTQLKYPYRVGFSPVYLNYELVYRLYGNLFGEHNIYLQAYEALKAQPEEEISRLFAWLGAPSHSIADIQFYEQVNASLSRQALSVLRVLNHVVPSRFNSLGSVAFTKQPKSRFYLRKWLQQYVDPKLIKKIFTATELELSSTVHAELERYYRKSNSTLAKDLRITLAEYGYLLEA
nr:sulfotransferase [Alteromonas genovensis]